MREYYLVTAADAPDETKHRTEVLSDLPHDAS